MGICQNPLPSPRNATDTDRPSFRQVYHRPSVNVNALIRLRVLSDQQLHRGMQQPFTAYPRVVNKLEKTQLTNKNVPTHPQELFNLLNSYHFPGNISELAAMVTDAVAQHQSGILSMQPFEKIIFRKSPDSTPSPSQTDVKKENIFFSYYR